MKSYIMRIYGWVLGFEKDESFQLRYSFKDCGFKAGFETCLTSVFFRSCFLNLCPQILEETFIVWKFETLSNFLFLTLQSFQDLSFYYHILFKEVLRIDIIEGMQLHDFLVHLCAYLEKNHVNLLLPKLQDFFDFDWTNGMTRNRHENIEIFQGSVTRSRARKIDLETQRKESWKSLKL
ncbi:hypothetical protein M9H77_16387 [Catharanthus roseus]|uniref:Uncharacterized protein n=1 Tax=Catharanthus roseus TaxID=4058 RepID=A0ACC0B1L7_CATRO|nr:hypothetical protein M9H77_16387 [Catharanthus roseus]